MFCVCFYKLRYFVECFLLLFCIFFSIVYGLTCWPCVFSFIFFNFFSRKCRLVNFFNLLFFFCAFFRTSFLSSSQFPFLVQLSTHWIAFDWLDFQHRRSHCTLIKLTFWLFVVCVCVLVGCDFLSNWFVDSGVYRFCECFSLFCLLFSQVMLQSSELAFLSLNQFWTFCIWIFAFE